MDFYRWIYSKDIAEWMAGHPPSIPQQAGCILSAPHRTLKEKLEGIKELYLEGRDREELEYIITALSSVTESIGSVIINPHCYYEIEMSCQGSPDLCLQDRKRYSTFPAAAEALVKRIQAASSRCGCPEKDYHGIVAQFCERQNDEYVCEAEYVLNWEGEAVYYLPGLHSTYFQGDVYLAADCGDASSLCIPYESGTIITTLDNPYLPKIKGILVNGVEPGEAGFMDDEHNQWIIAPGLPYSWRTEQTKGIEIWNLRTEYLTVSYDIGFPLPVKHLICRLEGRLGEDEVWLEELGRLIKADKRYFQIMMQDRRTGRKTSHVKEKRLEYVRNLAGRLCLQ